MIYTTGTVSTVSGSAIVSGTGTIILIKNGNANFIYMVDRVNSDTELVISQPATFTVKTLVTALISLSRTHTATLIIV
ncbi:hypothetical protein AB4J86_12595 [Proteus mirabilis]|uniref:hypothetical protein n=1 Tax=Proteus mirabilis TaxID=584 RepID=UPI003CFCED5B